MAKETYQIQGMHCASCAITIEKTFKKTAGVASVAINYGTETASVDFDHTKISPEALSEKIKPFGYSLKLPSATEMDMSENEHAAHLGLNQTRDDKLAELKKLSHHLWAAIPMSIISATIMAWEISVSSGWLPEMSKPLEEFIHHLLPIMATYILFAVGQPYLLGLYRFIRYGRANMDTLIGLGTLTAFLYSFIISAFEEQLASRLNVSFTYYDVTIVVITFITLGKFLEQRAKLKTGEAIQKLLELQAKTALVWRNNSEIEIPISSVMHDAIIIIKPGSKIPVDGVVVEGSSYVDESMISGEPVPVEKKSDDLVVAGTINTTGSFRFRATKVGSETMLAHIIAMVSEAQGSKAPIQNLADKISSVFVPIVLALSAITLGLWLIIGTPVIGLDQALSFGLSSFVGILVIACPCALGLATPTAIIVGVGKGAGEGILIKDAATLEKLHSATTIVFDKTGTITKGKPELVEIKNTSTLSREQIVSLLASLETQSEHPIAQAIVNQATEQKIKLQSVTSFLAVKGKGVQGSINSTLYFAGNERFMKELGHAVNIDDLRQETAKGRTPVLLANEKEILAIVFVADMIKDTAISAIKDLHKLGVKTMMLTGDDQATAHHIAQQVGIDEVRAELLPDEKLGVIRELQAKEEIVVMAGDGVNDAPALAQADVGIAMGTGTDVAIESAGITLLHGDITKIAKAFKLSRLTMRGIKQNLFWAFIYNIIGIPIAAGLLYPVWGITLSPIFAGLAMAGSSVSVVMNSLRLKTKKL